MTTFVDTSALLALLDRGQPDHDRAARQLATLHAAGTPLLTHNYVVVEATAVAQRRLGAGAGRALLERLVPLMRTVWVERSLHDRAVAAMLAAERRRLSLVDWVSFELMRELGVEEAFAFDRHFASQGFRVVP